MKLEFTELIKEHVDKKFSELQETQQNEFNQQVVILKDKTSEIGERIQTMMETKINKPDSSQELIEKIQGLETKFEEQDLALSEKFNQMLDNADSSFQKMLEGTLEDQQQ